MFINIVYYIIYVGVVKCTIVFENFDIIKIFIENVEEWGVG